MKVKDLAVKHPYHSCPHNYYDMQCQWHYDTASDFIACWKDTDEDLNLIFRWDVREIEEGSGRYEAEVFIIKQRKGVYLPIHIHRILNDEVEPFVEVLKRHWKRLNEMWTPLSPTSLR